MTAAAKATQRDLLIRQQPARTLAPPNRATLDAGSGFFGNCHLTTPEPPLKMSSGRLDSLFHQQTVRRNVSAVGLQNFAG